MTTDDLHAVTDAFDALAHGTRRGILSLLAQGVKAVGELANGCR